MNRREAALILETSYVEDTPSQKQHDGYKSRRADTT